MKKIILLSVSMLIVAGLSFGVASASVIKKEHPKKEVKAEKKDVKLEKKDAKADMKKEESKK